MPTGVLCSPRAEGPFLTSPGSAHSKLSLSVNRSTVREGRKEARGGKQRKIREEKDVMTLVRKFEKFTIMR